MSFCLSGHLDNRYIKQTQLNFQNYTYTPKTDHSSDGERELRKLVLGKGPWNGSNACAVLSVYPNISWVGFRTKLVIH